MTTNYSNRLRAKDWLVEPISFAEARPFIEQHHYARGASRTGVFLFGLRLAAAPAWLAGVTWWLPPTRVAAETVDRARWRQVLALSRMAVSPLADKNACSFMLGHSVRRIRRDGRFVSLVTYADESQGHDGGVYRACGWRYVGRTGASPRWVDPTTGRQVATQATRTRTAVEMRAKGYVCQGSFHKHKFVLSLTP